MKHILITGASSGIGEALVIYYADKNIMLSICGRDEKRLNDVADKCRDKGAIVDTKIIDVVDKDMMNDWILNRDNETPIDLVIANAGIGLTATGYNAAEETFAVNMNGVINTIHPILPKMEERGRGQIVLISSLAGYRGLPSAPAYSASKSFVKAYGEALRGKLKSSDLKVNIVCPGFVKSRLTDQNKFKMPGIIDANQSAEIIADGLKKNKGIIAFPWYMVFGVWFLSILPQCIAEFITTKLPNKA